MIASKSKPRCAIDQSQEVAAVVRVPEERDADGGQHPARGAAARLQHHDQQHGAEDDVNGRWASRPQDVLVEHDQRVRRRDERHAGDHPVGDARIVVIRTGAALATPVAEQRERENGREEHHAVVLGTVRIGPERLDEHAHRHETADHRDGKVEPWPEPPMRPLLVVLGEHAFDVGGLGVDSFGVSGLGVDSFGVGGLGVGGLGVDGFGVSSLGVDGGRTVVSLSLVLHVTLLLRWRTLQTSCRVLMGSGARLDTDLIWGLSSKARP